MIKKILGFFFAALVMSNGNASYPQTINLCLTVLANTTPYSFAANFYSSDIFDSGTNINGVMNGQYCVYHTYQKGPKNITLGTRVNGPLNDVLLIPGSTCGYLYNYKNKPGWLTSDYIGTGSPVESWYLTLIQGPPIGMYKYVFYVGCLHTSDSLK